MTTFDKAYDTNGGANRFFMQNGELYVWGQGVSGWKKLTGSDNSKFLAELWGGKLLSDGNVGDNKGSADGHNINMNQVSITPSGASYVVDFGKLHVGGSERISFATEQHAKNFLKFAADLNAAGLLDNVM